MISFFLIRYLHFIAVIMLVASVLIQHLALKPVVPRSTIVNMRKVNIIFAIFAAVALVTGLAQWLWGAKPAAFYSSNPILHTKVLLLFILGGLSVIPTIFLKKNEQGELEDQIQVPSKVVMCLRIELLLLFLMPLLASLMAAGIGLSRS